MLYYFHLRKRWSQRNSITSCHHGVKLLEHAEPFGDHRALPSWAPPCPKGLWDCQKAEVQQKKARLETNTAQAQAQTHTSSFKGQLERRNLSSKVPFSPSIALKPGCSNGIWNLTDLQLPPSLLLLLLLPGHSLGSLSFCLPSVFLLSLLGQVLKVSSDAACFIGSCNMEKNSSQIMFNIKLAWNEFLLQISPFLPSELIVQSEKSYLFLPPLPSSNLLYNLFLFQKNICNASPSSPSWYSLQHYSTQFILPYSFLILMLLIPPSLTLMSLKRKKQTGTKQNNLQRREGEYLRLLKSCKYSSSLWKTLTQHYYIKYPRILDIITSREMTWGQCLTSFYWLSLLISWCWFLNIFKSCCILSVRTKRIHVKASTNSWRQSHNLRCFTVIVSLRLLAEHQNHIRKNQNLTIRIIPSASQTRKNSSSQAVLNTSKSY